MPADEKYHADDPLGSVYWRDEVLQVMYWMSGEGFGHDFSVADLQRFLQVEEMTLRQILELLTSEGFLERWEGTRYALSDLGRREGGRRFADEFEEMLKPGHFECNEPDCECHDPDSIEAVCKHFSPPRTSPPNLIN